MATIFTVPMKGTMVTIRAGATNEHGRIMKCSATLTVDAVEVNPCSMVIAGFQRSVTMTDPRIICRVITDPNMIDWK